MQNGDVSLPYRGKKLAWPFLWKLSFQGRAHAGCQSTNRKDSGGVKEEAAGEEAVLSVFPFPRPEGQSGKSRCSLAVPWPWDTTVPEILATASRLVEHGRINHSSLDYFLLPLLSHPLEGGGKAWHITVGQVDSKSTIHFVKYANNTNSCSIYQ